jgi:hypothetical protein
VELECRPGETYFYGIRLKAFAFTDVGRMEFQQLTALSETFQLEDKTFVHPGDSNWP